MKKIAFLLFLGAALSFASQPACARERTAPQGRTRPSGSPASAAQPAPPTSRIRIQLVSRDQVDLSSQIAGKIASLPLREGDAFHAGEVLISLDCSLYNAQLHKAQADADAASELLDADRRLAALHSVGELEVKEAEAKMKASAAEVAYMATNVHNCTITAPFNGRVAKRSAAPQQYVEAGKPILSIIDTSHLELKMIVPSKYLAWLKIGHPLSVEIDEVGKSYPARVSRIGASVDPVTQTVDVIGALTHAAPELRPGMSGWAAITPAR